MCFLYFLVLIFILVGFAFFTLFERKILSYIQLRKGLNKVEYLGFIRPSDAIKLFLSSYFFLLYLICVFVFFCPMGGLFISVVLWMCLPFNTIFISFWGCFVYFLLYKC